VRVGRIQLPERGMRTCDEGGKGGEAIAREE
jgi:hypothetical protein